MNEDEIPEESAEKHAESPDDSLSDLPPTPAPATGAGGVALGAMLLAAAGAGAILLVGGTRGHVMGATRSVKLQWEERQLQMDQAEREFQITPQLEPQFDVTRHESE